MSDKTEQETISIAINQLCAWLDCEPTHINYESRKRNNLDREDLIDARVYIDNLIYLLELKDSGDASSVLTGIQSLESITSNKKNEIKTLVVPYMHEIGRKRCKEAEISWFDLSGNANIVGPGIRIIIEDQPNKFKKPGRSTNVFAPKSSRVTRYLLNNLNDTFNQREISNQTDLGEGYVSKIVRSLESQDLIRRDEEGYITVKDPDVLLDAWLEKYSFSKHNQIQGFIPSRSGTSLMQKISTYFEKANIKYAVTGLGAAWLYTHFASFRTVTIYVDSDIVDYLLPDLGFYNTDSGSNIIIATPNDQSLFWESRDLEGIECVHPIQAYLDLHRQPERAKEAMPELRNLLFAGNN